MPVFSIIIPTYQRPELLKRAVESVLMQNFKNFECLVINDDPADNDRLEAEIGALADDRVVLIRATKSNGGNYCRNFGISRANGDYIAFLDDDDMWFENKLIEHLKAHTVHNADLVYSSYVERWDGNIKPDRWVPGDAEPVSTINAIAAGKFSIGTTSSVTLKKSIISGKLFDEELASFQDWDAWLSILVKKPHAVFKKIKDPLLYFFQHDALRTSTNIHKRSQGLKQVLEKYSNLPGINGFYKKERLNIELLKIKNSDSNTIGKKAKLLFEFLSYPPFWVSLYAVKRTAKYVIKTL